MGETPSVLASTSILSRLPGACDFINMSTSTWWKSFPSGGRSADARTSSISIGSRASYPARSSCDRPLIGTAWLARQLASTGRRVRAGEIHRWMTAPVPLDEGDCAEAIFDGDVLMSCRR